jgi:hypothetical protein
MSIQKVIRKVFVAVVKVADQNCRSGSVRQRYGSADPDPDPYQNVTDPEH